MIQEGSTFSGEPALPNSLTCWCGHVLSHDSNFCKKCGVPRPVIEADAASCVPGRLAHNAALPDRKRLRAKTPLELALQQPSTTGWRRSESPQGYEEQRQQTGALALGHTLRSEEALARPTMYVPIIHKQQAQEGWRAGSGRPVPNDMDVNTNVYVDHAVFVVYNVADHVPRASLEEAARSAFGMHGVYEEKKFKGLVVRVLTSEYGSCLIGVFASSLYSTRTGLVTRALASLCQKDVAVQPPGLYNSYRKWKRAEHSTEGNSRVAIYFSHLCPGAPPRQRHESHVPNSAGRYNNGRWAFADMCTWALNPRVPHQERSDQSVFVRVLSAT